MNGPRNGRWLGLTWCCTVDTNGAEHDLAFGWTHQQAQKRCMHKFHRRTTTIVPEA